MKNIDIKLKSFNLELLKKTSLKIHKDLNKTIVNTSLISIPTKRRICCVLRSPHIDKDSREHFELRIHKRLLKLYYSENTLKNKIVKILSNATVPPGVLLKIKY